MRGLTTVVALLILGGATVGCATSGGPSAPALVSDAASVDILAQGAIDLEIQPLLVALEDKQGLRVAGRRFWRGRIGSKSVVVSLTDVGPLNVAVATTVGILTFRPKLVINQGTAGAHDPALKIFDILVGPAVDFGAFYSTHARAGAGVSMARWHPIYPGMRVDGREHEVRSFPSDERAMRVALETAYPHGRVLHGVIGSAYEFNNEIDRINWLHKTYGTSSEDMESAFASAVALDFETRFLVIRAIANSAFLTDPPQPIAAHHCGQFVIEVIKQLP